MADETLWFRPPSHATGGRHKSPVPIQDSPPRAVAPRSRVPCLPSRSASASPKIRDHEPVFHQATLTSATSPRCRQYHTTVFRSRKHMITCFSSGETSSAHLYLGGLGARVRVLGLDDPAEFTPLSPNAATKSCPSHLSCPVLSCFNARQPDSLSLLSISQPPPLSPPSTDSHALRNGSDSTSF